MKTIAYTGQQAPGTGASFSAFFSPTITSKGSIPNTGTVQFTAGLSGPGINDTNSIGIWIYEQYYQFTGFGLVARRGNPAPGFPGGTTFSQLGYEYPVILPHHNTVSGSWSAFFAIISGGINRRSVWLGFRGQNPQVIAFDGGSKAQHTIGPIYTPIRYNDAAPASTSISFSSAIYTGTYNTDTTALWVTQLVPDTAGNVPGRIVFRSRQQIPGLAPGFLFGLPETHVLCENGTIAFVSAIRINSGSLYGYGIWREPFLDDIEPVLVALNGVPVILPGLDAGESISQFEYLLSNARGSVAFTALISGAPGGYGFWAQDTGSWRMVWRRGMQAPGLPAGVTFQSHAEFSNSPVCLFYTDLDEPIFLAKLGGTGVTTGNDMSVWRYSREQYELLAREEDQMAGATTGVVFDRIERIAANRFGEIIVEATIRGPGITTSNNQGIWSRNPLGQYVAVAQKGNQIEVEPGVMRTINSVTLAGGNPDYYSTGTDGRSAMFNRLHQIAFSASFLENPGAVCMADLRSIFTDVPPVAGGPPGVFALHQNYPNPFNPSTVFSFELPVSSLVSLKVYDILGREVAALVHGEKEPGRHEVPWNAGGMASGVYLYRLQAGNYTETKKLILMR